MIAARRESALDPCHGSRRERNIELRLAGACLVWGLCFTGANFLLKRGDVPEGTTRWIVAGLPSFMGIVLLAAYTRYLRDIDELQRAIQLQALALGFGGGFLAICGYMTFVRMGAPAIDLSVALSTMPVFYAIAVLFGSGRYR
jgi:drug/metabolite transporter (DMT)-like permease